MNVLAICASPRKGGYTEYFTKIVLEELEKESINTEFISLVG